MCALVTLPAPVPGIHGGFEGSQGFWACRVGDVGGGGAVAVLTLNVDEPGILRDGVPHVLIGGSIAKVTH
jgi:hypothetical protein